MTIKDWVRESHRLAVVKGWHDGQPRQFGTLIALCHSELSEAIEAMREQGSAVDESTREDGKPEGVPSELADVLIRIFDLCGLYGIDLQRALALKFNYNVTRPYRHGGKKF